MNGQTQTGYSEAAPAQRSQAGLEETHWGYVVRTSAQPPVLLVAGQVLAWVAGALCLALGLGLWFVPGSSIAGTTADFKLGLTALLMSGAMVLVWFASRGLEPEWQIDTMRGEVREVLRNRAGRPTVLAHYGFDAIGGVVMDRVSMRGRLPPGHACLVLRLGNSARLMPLLTGPETVLAPLRDRLGRDLIVGPQPSLAYRPSDLRVRGSQSV